jgi:hypothetical protein
MVLDTSVSFIHLTRLIAREDLTEFSGLLGVFKANVCFESNRKFNCFKNTSDFNFVDRHTPSEANKVQRAHVAEVRSPPG